MNITSTTIYENHILFSGYEGEYVFEKIKTGNFYEQELLEKWTQSISSDSVVFDIGANLGNHSVYFAKICNAEQVYSFEPIKKNFDLLQRNCADNHCTQVHLYNIGLGEKNSRASMQDNVANFGAIELNEDTTGDIEIYALDEMDIPAPDFVKIDVEGFEVKVLRGMKKIIAKSNPVIWVEVRPTTIKDVQVFFKQQGYHLVDFFNFNLLYTMKENGKTDLQERLLQKYVENLDAAWTYKQSSMKYNSAYLYEQKKANELNELCKEKESKFLYEQKKANELKDICQKRESQFIYEQQKAMELKKEVEINQRKIDSLCQEKEHLAMEIEKYKASSEKYCSAYQYEQKKYEALLQEMNTYKKSKPYKMQHKIWTLKSKAKFYFKKYTYNLAYRVYRKIEPYPKLVQFAYRVNDKLQIIKDKEEVRQIYQATKGNISWKHGKPQVKSIKDLKIAAILDEFSYNCFKYECNFLVIEPDNWLDIFEREKPDLFFCESAWSGADTERRPWKGKIYSSINFPQENRTVLLSILAYCNEHEIPTIFWNKEDPSHYEDKVHNFVDTAIKFDHIFTTAEECVSRYQKEYGHKSVYSLMFATQPKMFNPLEKYERTDEVIFAGSWYSYHEQRCKEMAEIFDHILKSGRKLVIYNRYYGDPDPNHIFPDKYQPYVRPALPFSEIDKAYKGSNFALNITTVTESETMFARRVFELASCNTAILSNYSIGIEKIFGNNVIFTDRKLDFSNLEEKKANNLDIVLRYHTYANRLEQMLQDIGYDYLPEDKSVSVYYTIKSEADLHAAIENYQRVTYVDKHLKILYDDETMNLDLLREMESLRIEFYCKSYLRKYAKKLEETSVYVTYADKNMRPDFIERAIVHFSYLDEKSMVKQDERNIRICTRSSNGEQIVNFMFKYRKEN